MEISHLLKEKTGVGWQRKTTEGGHSKQRHRLSKQVIGTLHAWNRGNPQTGFWLTFPVWPDLLQVGDQSIMATVMLWMWRGKAKPLPTPKTTTAFDTVLFYSSCYVYKGKDEYYCTSSGENSTLLGGQHLTGLSWRVVTPWARGGTQHSESRGVALWSTLLTEEVTA